MTSARYRKTYPISWDQLHRDAKALAWRLLDHDFYQGIIAITRGGLVPAAIVAREMSIHVVDTLCITSYDEQVQGRLNILKQPEAALASGGDGWLLIDDLVDTGTTMKAAREILPKAHFATVYAKPKAMDLVDTYVHDIDQETWIFFPWDTEPQYARPLADGT